MVSKIKDNNRGSEPEPQSDPMKTTSTQSENINSHLCNSVKYYACPRHILFLHSTVCVLVRAWKKLCNSFGVLLVCFATHYNVWYICFWRRGVPATIAPEYPTDITVVVNFTSELVAAKLNHLSLGRVILILRSKYLVIDSENNNYQTACRCAGECLTYCHKCWWDSHFLYTMPVIANNTARKEHQSSYQLDHTCSWLLCFVLTRSSKCHMA